MIFCLGEGMYCSYGAGYHKKFCAWNKEVGETRYNEIQKEVSSILKDFKIDARNAWSEEWAKVTPEQWQKLSSIPEFDLDITRKITGLEDLVINDKNIL